MLKHGHSRAAGTAARVVRLTLLIALLVTAVPAAGPAGAEGSRDLRDDRLFLAAPNAGYRPHLEWHRTATSAGIPRQTTIKAYAEPGESIYVGSSAMGFLEGDVVFRSPENLVTGNCAARRGAPADEDVGRINNRPEELAGPQPAAGGFVPCVITPADTAAAGAGIWEFDFISPDPDTDLALNPQPLLMGAEWAGTDRANHWIAAWDVSVRDTDTAAGGQGDVEVPGRVFANYLAFNLGSNATAGRPDIGLTADFYILTRDGYGYEVDMNGIDPFAFIFFGNAEGITSTAEQGRPIYRSLQLVGDNATQELPPGYRVHNPRLPDDEAANDITHKIFFDLGGPDPAMPAAARSPSGETWLLRPEPEPPAAPGSPTFVGEEGTPGQAGTNPLGGFFEFDAPAGRTYNVVIDVNQDGEYGNANDRTIFGRTDAARTRAYWDGLDGAGQKVPAGPIPFNAIIKIFAGEVHFPFIDAENHAGGHRLRRVRDAGLPPSPERDPTIIYYDDAYTFPTVQPYDFSLCAAADSASPPPAAIDIRPTRCYGVQPVREATGGISSQAGAHSWTATFGDRRLIDTWTYYPSAPVAVSGSLLLAESELSIAKRHSPPILTPGGPVFYTVEVRNGGPSPAVGARVFDQVPPQVLGVTWTCAVSGGPGRCGDLSGSGNVIETTVDIDPGTLITYSITGTLDLDAAGSLSNTARVRRPNDNTDPFLANNEVTNVAPIATIADLELTKSLLTPPPLQANSELVYLLELRNRGPGAAADVSVSERLAPGLSFVSADATKGAYDPAGGLWQVGAMARNEVATLTIRARWDGTAVRNTAEVAASSLPDPDSTPGNGAPGEDDQSSVEVPGAIADLELEKAVSAPRVNVGQTATFTLTLANRGPNRATGVQVSDRLPVGLSPAGSTPSQGAYDPVTGVWDAGALEPGAAATLAIVATVLGPGPFTNIAQVAAADQYDPDSTPNNDDPGEDDQDFASLEGDLADLSLAKGVDNSQPNLGDEIRYTVTLRNEGPGTATGVEVTDQLPAGLAFVAAEPSQGDYDQATGLWRVGTVPAGGSATLAVRAIVEGASRIVNIAQITGADQPDPDSTPGNDDPGEDDYATVPLTPQVADLRLAKSASTARPVLGGAITYTIVLTNDGPFAATGVQVAERLPAGLTFLSATASRGSFSPSTGIWEVGAVAIDESVTLTISARMDGVGPFINSAEVAASDQFDPDSTPGNGAPGEDDYSTATVSSPVADLSVSKRATAPRPAADGAITYVVGAYNAGPDPATGVAIEERLPAGATLVGATPSAGSYSGGVWTLGDLAVGASALLTVTVTLSGPGPFVNVAEVSTSDLPDPDSTPGNGGPDEDDYSTVSLPSDVIDLELAQSVVSLDKLERGALLRITLLNRGPATATGVAVESRLPPELRFVDAAPSQGDYDPATATWTVGSLAPGATAQLLISAQIAAGDAEQIVNVAQVSRAREFDVDSTPNNNIEEEDDQETVRFSLLTPVTLRSLTATRAAEGVVVAWETGAEVGTRGFYLLYSPDGVRARAARLGAALVPARGGPAEGASYSYLHAGAGGPAPTYWLVEVAEGGALSEHGPVRVSNSLAQRVRVFLPIVVR